MNGNTGTFRMTPRGGAVMTGGCSATVTGTFDMDDMRTQMHGSYGGTNSCSGPFSSGQMSLAHR